MKKKTKKKQAARKPFPTAEHELRKDLFEHLHDEILNIAINADRPRMNELLALGWIAPATENELKREMSKAFSAYREVDRTIKRLALAITDEAAETLEISSTFFDKAFNTYAQEAIKRGLPIATPDPRRSMINSKRLWLSTSDGKPVATLRYWLDVEGVEFRVTSIGDTFIGGGEA